MESLIFNDLVDQNEGSLHELLYQIGTIIAVLIQFARSIACVLTFNVVSNISYSETAIRPITFMTVYSGFCLLNTHLMNHM